MSDNRFPPDDFDMPRFIDDNEPDEPFFPKPKPKPYTPEFLTPRADAPLENIPDGAQPIPDDLLESPSLQETALSGEELVEDSSTPFLSQEEATPYAPPHKEKRPPASSRRVPIGAEYQPKAPPPEEQSTFVNPALARVAAARPYRPPKEASELWLAIRTLIIVVFASLGVAFIFSYWTPDNFLSEEFKGELQAVSSTQGAATMIPTPLPTFGVTEKIGVIIGHSGPPLNPAFEVDPGAICDDNGDGIPELTELSLNTAVGQRVASLLVQEGYQVEILEEWDDRLDNYRATALVSIHTNTCENLGVGANGFNVQANTSRAATRDRDEIFVNCVAQTYAASTGLPRHFGTSPDLVDYHVFREVSLDTPTIIVELGFMFADRQLLVERPDDMARGITQGVLCFLKPEQFRVTPTAAPS